MGSSAVVDSSGRHQYEVWTDSSCSDPTHSLLSKDHFSNILNGPAGEVAATILKYIAPRVIYAWDHPDVPVDQVLNDVVRVFHHPALRDHSNELHRSMFEVVEKWSRSTRHDLNNILSSDSVRAGHNHIVAGHGGGGHGSHGHGGGSSSHSKTRDSPWDVVGGSQSSGGPISPGFPPQPSPGFQPYPSAYGGYEPSGQQPYQDQSQGPNYASYGPSQPYYDHAQAAPSVDQYSGFQTSYQQGWSDGNAYQQQPPPGQYGGYDQQQPPPGGYNYNQGPQDPYGGPRY